MSGTASVPGWWVEFQSAVLRQMPRPGEIDQATAESWNSNQRGLKKVLARTFLITPDTTNRSIEFGLYLHPSQDGGGSVVGFELEAHLKETGQLDRAYGLEDELVKGWIANPATYPEELKKKVIFLWKSSRGRDGERSVPGLVWSGGRVHVVWDWLGGEWCVRDPALLAS